MIRRARFGLLAAVSLAVVIVAVQFPFAALLHERATVSSSARELASVRALNASLARDVAALHQPSTIARIAQQDYGLVRRGETFEVVLPVAGEARSGTDPLADTPIPRGDLVPSDAAMAAPAALPPPSARSGGSFWSRFLDRLEFWKASS